MTRKKPDPTPAASAPEEAAPILLKGMPVPLVAALDDLAGSRGISRSALMREAIERGLRALAGGGVEPGLEADLAAARRLRWRLDAALAELALSEGEASLICDALNGTADMLDATDHGAGPAWLYAEVADAIALSRPKRGMPGEDLGAKHGVDAPALLKRLRALTPVQAAAIVEATRWFWRLSEVDTAIALRACGLVRS